MKNFFILLLLHLFSLQNTYTVPLQGKIQKALWLVGTWEQKTSQGSVYEKWKVHSNQELRGLSYSIEDGDTLIFERIQLLEKNNDIYYIPTVMDQNDQKPIPFKLTSQTSRKMIFENGNHDFPQMITYRQIGPDSLEAGISGLKNGSEVRLSFPMKKMR